MEHVKFVDKINKNGISVRSTTVEGVKRRIEIIDFPNFKNALIIEDGEVSFEKRSSENPMKRLIKEAIDIDEWKHSWHTEIKPENYDEIQEIIQKKIIKRSEEIEFLLSVYFQIEREKSNKVI